MNVGSFSDLARFLTEQSLIQNEALDPPLVDEQNVVAIAKYRPQLMEDIAESLGITDEDDIA